MKKIYQAAKVDAIFGQVIVNKRKEIHLGQAELARKMGVAQPTLSRIERGESSVTISSLVVLSIALDEQPSDLLVRYESVVSKIEMENVKVLPKGAEQSGDNSTLYAFLGVAALALILSNS